MINALPLALAALLSLAPAKPAHTPAVASPVANNASFVLVENHRNVPVEVFVEAFDGEQSLGMVAPGAAETLALDPAITSDHEVSFLLDPKGEEVQATQLIPLTPGKGIELKVPARPNLLW